MKSVVCFYGAHYLTYIKKRDHEGLPVWKLYDDHRQVQIIYSWKDILDKILDLGCLPTMLTYEKVTPLNCNSDMYDNVTSAELAAIDKKAYN